MAENYLQHAEHYYRVIAAAQAALQPATGLGRDDMADDAEDDLEPIGSDRFEPRQIDMRMPNGNGHYQGDRDQPPQQQHVRNDQDRGDSRRDYGDRQGGQRNEGYDRQGGQRNEGYDRQGGQRNEGYDRQGGQQDRGEQRHGNQDRGEQRHGNQDRGDQRHGNQERRDRNERRPRYERGNFDRRNDRGEQRPFEPRPVAAGGAQPMPLDAPQPDVAFPEAPPTPTVAEPAAAPPPVIDVPFLAAPAVPVAAEEEAEKPRKRRAPRARKAETTEDAETTKAD